MESVAADRIQSSRQDTTGRTILEVRHLNSCKKHLHFIGLLLKEIPYPVAMARVLDIYMERLFHLCFTVMPALDKWLSNIRIFDEAAAAAAVVDEDDNGMHMARAVQKKHLENLQTVAEHIKIDIIRCFYRFVQCFADHISSKHFSQMLIFVFAQMEAYSEHSHSTVLISMDFMRINCTVAPEHVRKFSPKLMQSACKLLYVQCVCIRACMRERRYVTKGMDI